MLARVNTLRDLLKKNGLDAAFITGLTGIRYYSGFTSEDAYLIVTAKKAYLLTDFRYTIQAKEQSPDFELVEVGRGALMSTLKELFTAEGVSTVGFDEQSMTVADFNRYSELGLTFKPFCEQLHSPRLYKTEEEAECLQKAQQLADKAYAELLKRISSGMTEKEVAAELDYIGAKLGSEGPSFETIVGSGPNGAMCHAVPGERRLTKGDLVVVDFGCMYNGYHSDMTRTFGVGAVDDLSRRVYDTVLKAQQAALAALKDGIAGSELHNIALKVIDEAGYGKCFGHGLGHGFGLRIHEAPSASPLSKDILRAGMTITVEPGIYIEGKCGVRIEDCCLVTKEGYRNFVSTPKELVFIQ